MSCTVVQLAGPVIAKILFFSVNPGARITHHHGTLCQYTQSQEELLVDYMLEHMYRE